MRRLTLVLLVVGFLHPGKAEAEWFWWECTKAFTYGYYVEGPRNIARGCYKTGKEICLLPVDAGGMVYEICSGNRYKCKGGAGQYLENGGSCGIYYRDFCGNVATFGVYGQCQAGYQCYTGQITIDECSERIGSNAVFQCIGARAIKCNAPKNSAWQCPIRQLPRHCRARICRKPTPFEADCGFQVPRNGCYKPPYILNEHQLGRICRTPGWKQCKVQSTSAPKRCFEFALDADGSFYCCPSGRNTIGGNLPQFKGCCYPPNARFTPCSVWKGLSLCKNPKGGSWGGISCRLPKCGSPVFQYKPPCTTGPFGGCRGLWKFQPRCIQPIRPPICTNPWVPSGCAIATGGACGLPERDPVVWPGRPGAPPVIELPVPQRQEIEIRRVVFPPAPPGTAPRFNRG